VIELTDHTAAPEIAVLRRYIDQARDHQIRIGVHVSNRIDHDLFAIIRPDIAKLRATSPTWNADNNDNTEHARYLSQLGAFVVAVGVDSRDALTHLQHHGIDAAQGHTIGLPRTINST
jgi:EAL domain-containing protein (putative c-di-GMP-specific phosphodiesterase class I)